MIYHSFDTERNFVFRLLVDLHLLPMRLIDLHLIIFKIAVICSQVNESRTNLTQLDRASGPTLVDGSVYSHSG